LPVGKEKTKPRASLCASTMKSLDKSVGNARRHMTATSGLVVIVKGHDLAPQSRNATPEIQAVQARKGMALLDRKDQGSDLMSHNMKSPPDVTASRSSRSTDRGSLTVPVPLPLREAVERYAADLDRSMASVVREALREYVTPGNGRGNA